MSELRHALRVLTRSPGPTIVVVLTLALGLGANIAIFSVVRAVLLQPLPYEAPERLVQISNDYGDHAGPAISVPELFFYRQTPGAIESMAGISDTAVTLADGGEPVRALAARVSPSLFPLLGVEAAHGRVFRPEEEQPGREPVVILSNGLWQRRFAGDPSVVGRTLSIDGAPHLVVGVLPPDFHSVMGLMFPGFDAELWKPLRVDPATFSLQRAEVHNLVAIARLAPEVDPRAAEAAFAPAVRQLEETYPEISGAGRRSVRLSPLSEAVTSRARPTLLLLLGAVAFVLLIACANVASLRLVAATVRRREIAVRRALGAAPGRLVRQMLTESLVLSLAGGVLGLLLALWGVDALRAVLPAEVPRLGGGPLDVQVLGFALALVVATGVLAGLAPALFARGVDLTPALRSGDVRSGADRRSLRLKTALVAGEVAVAAMLLVGAGLLLHSLWRLHRVDPGVDTKGVLTLEVHLPAARYDEPSKVIAFDRRMTDEVRTLPGVESAGMIHHLPPLQPSDWPFQTEDGEWTSADPNLITRGTFEALGIPLVRGRWLTDADLDRPGGAVLLNQTAARQAFGDENPVGRRINIDFGEPVWREVVGVVADVKSRGLGAPMRPQTWFPLIEGLPLHAPRSMNLVVRGGGDLADLGRQIRRRIATLDPEVAVSDVRPMSEVVAATLTEPRVTSWLLGAFAGVALALAALGIYGVLAFAVAGRIPELGLRMALGARRADVLGLILRQGLTVIAVGLALGLAASLALGRLLSRWLFEIHAADPLTLVLACVPLAAVALLACWLPARRAARVDPMVALRWE